MPMLDAKNLPDFLPMSAVFVSCQYWSASKYRGKSASVDSEDSSSATSSLPGQLGVEPEKVPERIVLCVCPGANS